MAINTTPFKMKGFSYPGVSPIKNDEKKQLFNTFTRSTKRVEGDQKYLKKKKIVKGIKNAIGDIGEGLKNYGQQVSGKRRPKGWCPKGGKCGGGPGVQRPSLARRLWPFPSLRQGGSQ